MSAARQNRETLTHTHTHIPLFRSPRLSFSFAPIMLSQVSILIVVNKLRFFVLFVFHSRLKRANPSEIVFANGKFAIMKSMCSTNEKRCHEKGRAREKCANTSKTSVWKLIGRNKNHNKIANTHNLYTIRTGSTYVTRMHGTVRCTKRCVCT